MNFAADAKSTSRIFFDLENPEISTVLDPKLVGGRGQYFALRQSKIQKKIFFSFSSVFFIWKQTTYEPLLANFRHY